MDQGLYEFDKRYRRNLADPVVMDEYRRHQLAIWDEQDRWDTAIFNAKTEGEAKGKIEGQAVIIRTMMETMSIADIAAATHLSPAEIEALAKD